MSCSQWLLDFAKRVEQLRKQPKELWFGGLFFPEAYLTATAQTIAEKNSWSMGELVQIIEVGTNHKDDAFVFTGVKLEGAAWSGSTAVLTDELSCDMPPIGLRWIHQNDYTKPDHEFTVPVYLNPTRTVMVTTMSLPTKAEDSNTMYLQRGMALLLWSRA
jgi:dynein heavy chain 1